MSSESEDSDLEDNGDNNYGLVPYMYKPTYSNTNYQYESSLSDSNSSDVECDGDGDSMNDSSAREKRSGNLLYRKCG